LTIRPRVPPYFGAPLTLASLLLVAWPLAAQERDADERVGLPTIEVRGILPEDATRAPGAMSILTAEELARLRPYTLHDAFDFVAGVRTLDDDAFGRRAGISIRGAPTRRSRKVLLLEDGTPINASTYLDPSAHYTPPMERIERIEVLKANGQILHGPLNNHGVINFRNRGPSLDPTTTAEVALGTQSAGKQHVMHQRTDGRFGSVVSYTRFSADGIFDVEETEYQDFYGALQVDVSDRQDLALSGVFFRERSRYDESNLTPQEFALAPRRKLGRFGQEFNNIAVDYSKFDLTHNLVLGSNWAISSKLFASDLDRPRFTVDPGEYDVAALPELVLVDGDGAFVPGVNGAMISRNRRYRIGGVETRIDYGPFGGTVSHRLQWGARIEQHRFDDRRSIGTVGEVLTASNRGSLTRHEPYQADAHSVFLQDVIAFGDWTVIPGFRAERYTQRKQRVFPSMSPQERYEDSLLLPGVSVLYDGFGAVRLFASVQRGYTPAIARGSSFPLTPEVGVNAQVGARSVPLEGLTLEVAAFHNQLDDTLVQLPFVDPVSGANLFVNEADSKAYGVDLSARFESGSLMNSPFRIVAALAFNQTRATFTKGLSRGKHVPEIPSRAGSLTLGVEHARGWHVSATLSQMSRFFTDPANTRTPILATEDGVPLGAGDTVDLREPVVLGIVPSRTLLSARASYTLAAEHITFWIQGRNLTEREYIADFSNGLRPGPGRALIGGVALRF
jgi:Fe(3+) dicitrate transport protein